MNVYDYMDTWSTAVKNSAGVLSYCQTNFGRGLLVQIDDDNESPISSDKAPYCLLSSATGSDNSPVSDMSSIRIRCEVGVAPITEPPYFTDSTARSATANGLRKYGNGEKAVDLLDLCLTAIKGATLDAQTILTTSDIDADGMLFFPLQLAVTNLTVSESKDLSEFV